MRPIMQMRRLFLFLFLFISLSTAAYGQTRGVERQRYLNGAVQSLQVETANMIRIFGTGDSTKPREYGRNRVVDYTYDEKGNLLDAIRYDPPGKLFQREIFRYDDRGRVLEELRFDSSKDKPVERVTHRYDSDGRRNETLQYDQDDRQIGRIAYAYDSAGRLTEKISYKAEKVDGKAVLAYDDIGRVSSFIAYDSRGDIPNQIISHYDDKANAVQRARSNLKGDLEGTTVTTYDTIGNVTTILHHRPNGSPAWKWEFEYDEKGNVIKEQFANKASLSVWVYAYEYDSMGNWTKKSKSQLFDDRGKLIPDLRSVTYRSFKYYSKKDAVQAIAEPADSQIVRDPILSMAASEIRPIKTGAALAGTQYPEPLGRAVNSGTLEIDLTIDIEGNVASAKVISGGDVLAQKPAEVEQKLMKGTYQPVLLNGVPVKVTDRMSLKSEVRRPGRGAWK